MNPITTTLADSPLAARLPEMIVATILIVLVLGGVFGFLWRMTTRFTDSLEKRDAQFIAAIDGIEQRHEAGEMRAMDVAKELVEDCKSVIRENTGVSIRQAETNARVAVVLDRVEAALPKAPIPGRTQR